MNSIEALMHDWLAHGTPDQQRHARARIAIGFDPVVSVAAPAPIPRHQKPRIALGQRQKR